MDTELGRAWREMSEALPEDALWATTVALNTPGMWLVHTSWGIDEEDDFEAYAPSVLEGLRAVTRAIREHRLSGHC